MLKTRRKRGTAAKLPESTPRVTFPHTRNTKPQFCDVELDLKKERSTKIYGQRFKVDSKVM